MGVNNKSPLWVSLSALEAILGLDKFKGSIKLLNRKF